MKNETIDIELPASEDWIKKVREEAFTNMKVHGNCTQSVLAPFLKIFKIENPELMRSASPMFGGMLNSLVCGAHTGALMVLGLLMGREKLEQGKGTLFNIIPAAQELMVRLNKRIGSSSCSELTGVDFTDLEAAAKFGNSKEHEKCFERTAIGAEEVAKLLVELKEKGELFRIAP